MHHVSSSYTFTTSSDLENAMGDKLSDPNDHNHLYCVFYNHIKSCSSMKTERVSTLSSYSGKDLYHERQVGIGAIVERVSVWEGWYYCHSPTTVTHKHTSVTTLPDSSTP